MESDLNEVRKKINDRDPNKSKQESYNNNDYNNKNYDERNEDMIQLEKAIELHNQSRDI